MMQYTEKWRPCKYCPDGMVRFFMHFHDEHGVFHRRKNGGPFVMCTNPDCPGAGGDRLAV